MKKQLKDKKCSFDHMVFKDPKSQDQGQSTIAIMIHEHNDSFSPKEMNIDN